MIAVLHVGAYILYCGSCAPEQYRFQPVWLHLGHVILFPAVLFYRAVLLCEFTFLDSSSNPECLNCAIMQWYLDVFVYPCNKDMHVYHSFPGCYRTQLARSNEV